MTSVPKYIPHHTVDDYLQWTGDWELWEGIPVSMTPSPFGRHQLIASRLSRQIGNQLESHGTHCEVLHEIDWIVSNDIVVRPDLVVICGRVPDRHLQHAPVLVAEVLSESTAEKDRTAKYYLYESQRVRFYLMADPAANALTAYELDPVKSKYELVRETDDARAVLEIDSHRIEIDTSNLFRD